MMKPSKAKKNHSPEKPKASECQCTPIYVGDNGNRRVFWCRRCGTLFICSVNELSIQEPTTGQSGGKHAKA